MTAILQSNLETDLRLASSLAANLRVLLADQASLRTSGVVTFLGSVNGSLTDTLSERFAGLDGYDAFAAASSEASDESSTALTDASASVAVARMVIRRDISDLAVLTGNGAINPRRLAASMVGEYEQGWMQLLADAIDDAATDVGSSGVDMSVSDFFDAIYQLELSSVPTPLTALLHPRQIADLTESLRAEGGAIQYMPASQAMLEAKGQGLAGELLGVSIFKSSKVNSAGGNRHGAMMGAGTVGYRIGVVEEVIGSQVIRADEFIVEFQRDSSASTTEIVGSSYLGIGIIEQARIVGIVTDA